MEVSNDSTLFFLENIPQSFTAADLRNIFSQFIEENAFVCFHFRRRPALRISFDTGDTIDLESLLCRLERRRRKCSMYCGLFVLKKEFVGRLKTSFEDLWFSEDRSCFKPSGRLVEVTALTNITKVQKLIEFRPPLWMPHGNVGTPLSHFFELIRTCRLSSNIISRLGLTFPKSLKHRIYGAVPFNYVNDPAEYSNHHSFCNNFRPSHHVAGVGDRSNKKLQLCLYNPVCSDQIPEEWDRFESLHDDPYNVERSANMNLKYESKIELKWEKGGPGLVHYMDEFAWRQADCLRKDEFFNEPSSFDWDIDTEHYEGGGLLNRVNRPGGTDLDSSQLMEINGVCQPGLTTTVTTKQPRSQDISRKLMFKYGWRPGSRLGRTSTRGLLHPISTEGALPPRSSTGFGFYGPKRLFLSRFRSIGPQNASPGPYIRSVFDAEDLVTARNGSVRDSTMRPDPALEVKYRANWCEDNFPLLGRKNKAVICAPHSSLGIEGIRFLSGGFLHPLPTNK